MSGLVNKIKEAVHGDKSHSSHPEGTSGPHTSRVANAADPRVDSDRDHRAAPGGLTGTHGTTGVAGTHGTTGYGSSTTAGPHSSNIANKADPRVDSDRDGRGLGHGTTGVAGTHGTSGLTGTHGTTGVGGTHGTAGYGSGHATTTAGPHSSNIANKADPRVDSDRDGRGLGPGPAPGTAGPHKSDMLNKIDPRVDSNLDGSKTVGGNKTYQAGTTTGLHKDPTDAAQVPPSVLQKTVGAPVVEHGDHGHDRARRNSTTTHQEAHRCL